MPATGDGRIRCIGPVIPIAARRLSLEPRALGLVEPGRPEVPVWPHLAPPVRGLAVEELALHPEPFRGKEERRERDWLEPELRGREREPALD